MDELRSLISNEFQGSRVAQRSKALHLSARGVTTDPGLIPGCITTGRDWESHRALSRLGFGQGRPVTIINVHYPVYAPNDV